MHGYGRYIYMYILLWNQYMTDNCVFVITSQITSMVPKITGLQEALPKSIGLLPFDGGIAGKGLLYCYLLWSVSSSLSYLCRPLPMRRSWHVDVLTKALTQAKHYYVIVCTNGPTVNFAYMPAL